MAVLQSQSGGLLAFEIFVLLPFPIIALLYVIIHSFRRFRVKDLRNGKWDDDRYEDEDGIASDVSLIKGHRWSSTWFTVVAVTAGLVAFVWEGSLALSTSSASTKDVVETGAALAVWIANFISTVCFAIMPEVPMRYRCGLACASGHLAACVFSIARILESSPSQSNELKIKDRSTSFLSFVQVLASLVACIGSLSVPRRPHIKYFGRAVDKAHTVSAMNKWTLAWAKQILLIARSKGKLELEDFPILHRKARSDYLLSHSILGTSRRPLWKALLYSNSQPLLGQSLFGAVQPFLQFVPALVLFVLLRDLEDGQTSDNSTPSVWMWIVALGISLTLTAWIDVWLRWLGYTDLALKIRSELSALIYAKATKCIDLTESEEEPTGQDAQVQSRMSAERRFSTKSSQGKANKEPGRGRQRAVNLLAIDVQRLCEFIQSHYLFLQTTISLILSLSFLCALLGWKPMLAGLAMFLLIFPFNLWSSRKSSTAQVRLMGIKDQKLTALTETLCGIRQIKFTAQEDQWEARLGNLRRAELSVQWLAFCYETVLICCYVSGPIVLSAAALTTYAIIHGELSASVAFTSMTVFSILEASLSVIPRNIAIGIQAWISIGRIEDCLKSPARDHYITVGDHIAFENATLSWQPVDNTTKRQKFMLCDVDLRIPNGGLTVVCGSTGSGKSLVIASLIGEAYLHSGRVRAPKRSSSGSLFDMPPHEANWIINSAVALVAQTPWLENATIRDNILFGLPYRQDRYDKVINNCALKHDLEILADGDLTELGYDGVNLSGGQKWRISFARALYSRAGILVIDDLFSAVDAPVARHLLDNALVGELGCNRTRILVTHHTELCIFHAELVVFLEKGRVLYSGPPEGWQNTPLSERTIDGSAESPGHTESKGEGIAVGHEERYLQTSAATDDNTHRLAKPVPKIFLEKETKTQGSVKFGVYLTYVRASGGVLHWSPILALFIGHQALLLGRLWFVGYWTHSSGTKKAETTVHLEQIIIRSTHHSSTSTKGLNYYIGIYIGLSLCLCVSGALRYFLIYMRSIKASRTMFARMAFVILRAPLRWLDTVPMGRILNRFSSDFEMVDSQLGTQLGAMMYCFLQIVGTIVAASFVSPLILVVVVVLFASCAIINKWYIVGAREVKRLEAIARSPIFEMFGSTLSGITTIRTYGRTDTYISHMLCRIDKHTSALYYLWLLNSWVTFRLNIVGTIFTMAVAVSVLYAGVNASLAGFALSFVLQYSSAICRLTGLYSNVELAMNSIERISEYADLAIEDQANSTTKASASWPAAGQVDVSGLVAGYSSELPSVLNGLTFSIAPNERVGVIGRTGAGKSSLALALLRLLDVRAGSIHIDSVDIAHIPLPVLRSRLAMISQDPILFSGTVRSNLDGVGACDDTELQQALQRVNISSSPGVQGLTLDSIVAECGLNLSQGQRQLLCLARAIVRRPKILILDEATSAIDFATDRFIQRSIRSEFTNSTLIVIAHRLSTVADFDKVLVMENGQAVEFGRPRELLLETGGRGLFRYMVDHSGDRENLRDVILGEELHESR